MESSFKDPIQAKLELLQTIHFLVTLAAHMEQQTMMQNFVQLEHHDYSNQLIKWIKMSTHMPYRPGTSLIHTISIND